MAGMDLSKQVGPLPLGAWIIVVGAGLGIAFYTRNQNARDAAPVEVEDQSGVPGVGTGAVGGWMPTTPPADTITPVAITTNEQWATRAINDLIAQNYSPTLADSAIRNYVAGIKTSIAETALVAIALTKWGSPPQPLPPVEGGTGTPPPPAQTAEYADVGKGFYAPGLPAWILLRRRFRTTLPAVQALNPDWPVVNNRFTRTIRIRIR